VSRFRFNVVMAGPSRLNNGVTPLAYVPAIHVLAAENKAWMPGTRPGMTMERARL
jgi:hypothetical protein